MEPSAAFGEEVVEHYKANLFRIDWERTILSRKCVMFANTAWPIAILTMWLLVKDMILTKCRLIKIGHHCRAIVCILPAGKGNKSTHVCTMSILLGNCGVEY